MKKIWSKILVLTVVATSIMSVGVVSTFADTIPSKSTISVNGSATIKIKPDVAYVNIGVESKEKTAIEAQNKNKEAMDKVIAAIKAQGIKSAYITTENYSLNRGYDYVNETQVEYFLATNTVKVKIYDFTKIGKVIDASAEVGANQINSVSFTSSQESKYYRLALDKALKDALSKGKMMASLVHKTNYKYFRISESSYNTPVYRENVMYSAMDAKAVTTPIISGDVSVTANVQVELEY